MAKIIGKSVSIDFPIYGVSNRSLRRSFLNIATGGILSKDAFGVPSVKAINAVSFEFVTGDRIGLIGHNGSGKSTFLRLLAGIYHPTSGYLSVEGTVNTMIGLSAGMDLDATGLENINIRARLMGLKPFQITKCTEDIISFSGLGSFIDFPVRTYSSGMLMRLSFSISTSIPCDILLLDEWLSVGDASFMESAKIRLKGLVDSAGIVVFASHNDEFLDKECNKLFKLDHGSLSRIR